MRKSHITTDVCVVGGGMSGLCAAIAAARHGAKVVLMQDRPVLGGNASSEIRMWICGAHAYRETGLLEEIELENLYRNPTPNFSIWDSVLYEKARFEKNIQLLLNCSCLQAEMDGPAIHTVTGWQMTSETWHTIEAKVFIDCSGDGILAPLTGAEYRIGREARSEFNESIEPVDADKKTMGMSCLFQIRETDKKQTFIPPKWANRYESDEDLPFRNHNLDNNFWWIELGGENDSIHDTEEIRDELLKISFGVWDHIKNHGDHGADNWVIDWIGFLPGKRESRRYVGDYILTQNDIESGGKFEDIIAYGGWSMDDHHPAGFDYKNAYPTIFHPAPSPYGIPYRCLYSRNIENLMFAGRNISTTHAALSSTRIMGTCSLLGQAAGTAAAISVEKGMTPRNVGSCEISALQTMLMEDDCFLPGMPRPVSALTKQADKLATQGDTGCLVDGIERAMGGESHLWEGNVGDSVEYHWDCPQQIYQMRFVFNSHLERKFHNMPCNFKLNETNYHVPETVIRRFRVEYRDQSGVWAELFQVDNNYQRLVRLDCNVEAVAVRFTPLETWGAEKAQVFSWEVR